MALFFLFNLVWVTSKWEIVARFQVNEPNSVNMMVYSGLNYPLFTLPYLINTKMNKFTFFDVFEW